jgi:hypothetical protein
VLSRGGKLVIEQLEQTRTIDANLHAERFFPREFAILTIVIRAPKSQAGQVAESGQNRGG